MNNQPYNIATIRDLIRNAFTANELRRFCRDQPILCPILPHFGPGFSFEDMIETIIEQCQKQALLPDLLEAIQKHNPRQYHRYSGQLLSVAGGQRVVNLRLLDMTHTFKDREQEVQMIREYLTDEHVRLVSVVGRGGMGKTALVCHVLAELEGGILLGSGEDREITIDGILYLSSRSTGLSLERIYVDLGRMLGEPLASRLSARWTYGDASMSTRVDYLLEAMQNGLYVILLDNLEDVLGADGKIAEDGLCLFVERCLIRPSGARLVVTSREQIQVSTAALHAVRTIFLGEGLPDGDAVALLRELDPQGMLGLYDASADVLRQTVQRTRGIPRALELLVGILVQDPTANITGLLADERLFGEKVVEQLVEEGYCRLGDDERRVMEALAVLDQPIVEKAVAHILQPWFLDLDVHTALHRLVGSYFVSASRATGEYSLHPLDREYAYRRLPGEDGSGAYTRCNLELCAADYYASIRKSQSEWKTIEDLTPQLAEFDHRIRAQDYAGACRVLEPIDYAYLYRWGQYDLLVRLREQLLGCLQDPGPQMDNSGSLGNAYYAVGQFSKAIFHHEEALSIATQLDDITKKGRYLGALGRNYWALGQFEQAAGYQEEALYIARETNDRWAEAIQLTRLGLTYRSLEQIEKAIEFHKGALAVGKETNDRWEEGSRLGNLGSAYRVLGQSEKAINLFKQALAITREVGDRRGESVQLGRLGIIHRDQGSYEQAIDEIERALDVARDIGDRSGEAFCLNSLGSVYYARGQVEKANSFYTEALTISCEIQNRRGEGYCRLSLAKMLLAKGELSTARDNCMQVLNMDIPSSNYQAALVLGIVLLGQHDQTAEDAFTDTINRCRDLLDKTANLYQPRYALATALVGSVVSNSAWTDARESGRSKLLAPALVEYERALENCVAFGVVQDVLRDLELIRAAGVEGLEPIFGLLKSRLNRKGSGE